MTSTGGGLTAEITDTGNKTLNVTNSNFAGDVVINGNSSDDFTAIVSGVTATGGGFTTTVAASVDDAVVSLASSTFDGAVDVTAGANNGTFAATIAGVTSGDTLNVATASGGDAMASVTNSGFMGEAVLALNNTGALDLTMTGNTITTGNDQIGLDVSIGGGATGGDLVFQNNGVTTGDNQALDLTIGVGAFDLALITNTLDNNSVNSRNTLIDSSGGGATLDATIFTNIFTNAEAGATEPEFEFVTSAGTPTINLNLSGNTATRGAGTGEFVLRENAGDFTIFERDATINNVGNRNDGTITPLPAAGDFVESVGEPNNPAAP